MPLDGSNYETELTRWLIEGRENLLRLGWCSEGAYGSSGSVCMLAALPVWGRVNDSVQQAHCALEDAIGQLFGRDHIPLGVAYWNDMPVRTLDEVIAVYDRAIEISRKADQ